VHLPGRQTEFAGLGELLDGPGGGAMVILGEADAGKSALLAAAAAQPEDRGIGAPRVTGYRAESPYPYAGLHQLLLPVLDDLAGADEVSGRILPRIGAQLNVSPETVAIHLSRVFEPLGMTGRAQLRKLGQPAE
jgi:hypothetical protein